jgi:TonB-dependent starch-binding outer membrane protein SusC
LQLIKFINQFNQKQNLMIKQLRQVVRLLPVLLLCVGLSAFAQERKVSGKVTASDDGTGIPGVNVLEKGTTNGTVTDADGKFNITVGANASLVLSAIGFTTQEVVIGTQSEINVSLATDVTSLSEIVVTGYGTQDKKEITGSVVSLGTQDFNKGNVNDPTQLLQGKVPGLSIYNRGGNPNSSSTLRLRGLSTVGANTSPLVVVDGVIGASLDNVDPNDIESVNVLKDGSAAAIYGSRGSSGVIIVTTKRGTKGSTLVEYNGYVALASKFREVPVMSAGEYVAAGGNDLGSATNWQDEVTRTGVTNVHNLSIGGRSETTSFRVSTNFRNVGGILKGSGFDQINARANLNHKALEGKLRFEFNIALTNRNSNFSFNDALRYAVLFNPTAPVRFPNGNYYQAVLFDNFNPVAIIEQNKNTGKRKTLNYSARVDYDVLKSITLTASYAQQQESNYNSQYYSRSSLYRGYNSGGLARRYSSDSEFNLFEAYATYSGSFDKIKLDVVGGYSFQQEQFSDFFLSLGNFPSDALGYNAIETSGDLVTGLLSTNSGINSSATPKNRIIAGFARVNLTFDNAIFFNASVRREGSTKLGSENRYGIFPAASAGVDLNRYLNIGNVDNLKVRVGYGVTGSLPRDGGAAQDQYVYSSAGGGSITLSTGANKGLKWEEKTEINAGIDFGIMKKLSGSIDAYTRNIENIILLNTNVDPILVPSGQQFQNVGSFSTKGLELALSYKANLGQLQWTPGIVASTYKTKLDSYLNEEFSLGSLGAPGQNSTPTVRVAVGEELGQIWGPVFDGVESNGQPRFKDLNGDGTVKAGPGSALADDGDFKKLGSGFPTLELGWTNLMSYKNWDFNVFFRGAFGHSLVNSFRAFYEPIDPGAINSYNRIVTDKAVAGLTGAQYSSLYVEKADFLKLDNLTIGYNIKAGKLKNCRVYVSGQNLFVLTNYTGIDPEPSLVDTGDQGNGDFAPANPDVLAAGLDRRDNYFVARTFTFGLNIGF